MAPQAPCWEEPEGLSTLVSMQELSHQWEVRLGVEGARELLRELRARREAAHFVAMGGMDAALALREARGDVARAQAWLSQAKPQRAGALAAEGGTGRSPREGAVAADNRPRAPTKPFPTERPGGLASLVDESVGPHTGGGGGQAGAGGTRSRGPAPDQGCGAAGEATPVPGRPAARSRRHPAWAEYVAYYEKRMGELKQGKAAEGPLRWASYEKMWGWFTRGLAFERPWWRCCARTRNCLGLRAASLGTSTGPVSSGTWA